MTITSANTILAAEHALEIRDTLLTMPDGNARHKAEDALHDSLAGLAKALGYTITATHDVPIQAPPQ